MKLGLRYGLCCLLTGLGFCVLRFDVEVLYMDFVLLIVLCF